MTSPLMIQIGLHYYYCADEFDRVRINAPAVQDALASFVTDGLLIKLDQPTDDGATYKATEGLRIWCEALCAVPLPVRRWVMLPITVDEGRNRITQGGSTA